jgi:hypothetical protein
LGFFFFFALVELLGVVGLPGVVIVVGAGSLLPGAAAPPLEPAVCAVLGERANSEARGWNAGLVAAAGYGDEPAARAPVALDSKIAPASSRPERTASMRR